MEDIVRIFKSSEGDVYHIWKQDIRLSVVEIAGIDEIYYFHVIYRESHSMLAAMIGADIKEGFGK